MSGLQEGLKLVGLPPISDVHTGRTGELWGKKSWRPESWRTSPGPQYGNHGLENGGLWPLPYNSGGTQIPAQLPGRCPRTHGSFCLLLLPQNVGGCAFPLLFQFSNVRRTQATHEISVGLPLLGPVPSEQSVILLHS